MTVKSEPSDKQVSKKIIQQVNTEENVQTIEEKTSSSEDLVIHSAKPVGSQPKEDEVLIKVTLKPLSGSAVEVELDRQDSVMDLKTYLMDSPESCYYTHFNLRMDNFELVSDYAEVGTLLPDTSSRTLALHMVEACYDERAARTHVKRLKEILAPPQVTPGSALFALLPSASAGGDLHFPPSDTEDGSLLPEVLEAAATEPIPSTAAVVGFDFGVDLSVRELPCLKSLMLSPFNPPTPARKLQGDLAYYDVVLCDDRHYCITACSRGFFVNRTSTGAVAIVPTMDTSVQLSYTLVGLLNLISASFKRNFPKLLMSRSLRDPFELTPNNTSFSSWISLPNIGGNGGGGQIGDDSLLGIVYGMEVGMNARDWNEEHQSCRELPRGSARERSVADRTLYKVSCDFHEAAARGAAAIVDHSILPLNPMDPETSHMYVYNSIFFSYAAEGREAAAAASATATAGTGGDDSQSELATYASANQDLDGVIRLTRSETQGLHTLATAIVDYRGHRVVAQSIVPGILQCEQLRTLIHGPVEGGRRFLFHEALHERLQRAGEALHMREHRVVDSEGTEHRVIAPAECKGIMGSDGRTYLMDMVRVTPRDPNCLRAARPTSAELTPTVFPCEGDGESPKAGRDSSGSISPSGSDAHLTVGGGTACDAIEEGLLRWELVRNYCRLKELEATQAAATVEGAEPSEVGVSKPLPTLSLNVDAILPLRRTEPTLWRPAGSDEELAADVRAVEEAVELLTNSVIPSVAERCRDLELMPLDGCHLAEILHQEGVNLRYLGRVVAAAEAAPAPYLKEIALREMVARGCKHVFRVILRRTGPSHLASAVAHLLSCLFGKVNPPRDATNGGVNGTSGGSSGTNGKGKKKHRGAGKAVVDPRGPAFELGSDSLWIQLRDDVLRRYGYELSADRDDLLNQVRPLPTLRAVALQSGIQLAARDYDILVRSSAPFSAEDVTDLYSRTKSTLSGQPKEARELLELGRTVFELGHLPQAYDTLRRALGALQAVCGPLNADAASCHALLGLISSASQDHVAALSHHQRALTILERVRGWDHPESAQAYAGMGRAALALGRPRRALAYLRRAETLMTLAAGPSHPSGAKISAQVAAALQALGAGRAALRVLHRAAGANEAGLGTSHPVTALSYRGTAAALSSLEAFPLAARNEQRCLDILRSRLGDDHEQVHESHRLIAAYTARAKLHNAQQLSTGISSIAPSGPAPAAVCAGKVSGGAGSKAGKSKESSAGKAKKSQSVVAKSAGTQAA